MKRGDLVVFFINQDGEYNMTSFHTTGSRDRTFIGKITSGIIVNKPNQDVFTFCRVFTNTGTHYVSVHDMCLAEEVLYGKKKE